MTAANKLEGSSNSIQAVAISQPLMNSLIVAMISTMVAVGMGTITAYRFSRFRLADDLLFYPVDARASPSVVAIPMYLMYREVGLNNLYASRPDHPLHGVRSLPSLSG